MFAPSKVKHRTAESQCWITQLTPGARMLTGTGAWTQL